MVRLLLALAIALVAARADADTNIVLVVMDDVSNGAFQMTGEDETGIANDTTLTPSIKALADAGTRYSNTFVSPLCSPFRASVLTGRRGYFNGVVYNTEPAQTWWNQATVPSLLQSAGYKTAMFGKSGLGVPPVSGPWTHFAITTDTNGTFDNPSFYECTTGGSSSCESTPVSHTGGTCVSLADYAGDSDCYVGDELIHMAENWMTSVKSDSGGFFVWLALKSPHPPTVPPLRYDGALNASTPTRPASYSDTRSGRTTKVQNYSHNLYSNLLGTWAANTTARPTAGGKSAYSGSGTDADKASWVCTEFTRDYFESMHGIDDVMGRLTTYLAGNSDENGVLSTNTVVILVGDNGQMLCAHGLHDKATPYKQSVRVPLIIKGPGITAGAVKSELVEAGDISATILDIANVSQPATWHGRTLLDLVGTPSPAWRTSVLVQGHWKRGVAIPEASWIGLFTSTAAIVSHWDPYDLGTREWELLDYTADPTELTNYWSDASHFQQRETLRSQMLDAMEDAGLGGWSNAGPSTAGSGLLP